MHHLESALTPQQREFLPTEEDVRFYEEHGWFIAKQILPEAVIDEAIEGSEAYYRGERDASLKVNSGFSDWKPTDGDIVRNNEFVSLQKNELRQLALQPILGAIAARLARADEIRLLDDQLVYKPPAKPGNSISTTVGWHSDGAYWGTWPPKPTTIDTPTLRPPTFHTSPPPPLDHLLPNLAAASDAMSPYGVFLESWLTPIGTHPPAPSSSRSLARRRICIRLFLRFHPILPYRSLGALLAIDSSGGETIPPPPPPPPPPSFPSSATSTILTISLTDQ